MLKVVQNLLDRLAQRCLASAGAMLASTLESLHIAHLAHEQRRLEDLARAFEADGMPDIAAFLRERAKRLSADDAVADAKVLLAQLAAPSGAITEDISESNSSSSALDSTPSRRIRARAKPTSSGPVAASPAAVDSAGKELFFPINAGSSDSPVEDATV